MARFPASLPRAVSLFGLLFNSRDLADAIEERGDDALRHGRDGSEHLREERTMTRRAQTSVAAKPCPP